jgi:hypothetical protein
MTFGGQSRAEIQAKSKVEKWAADKNASLTTIKAARRGLKFRSAGPMA